MGKKKGKKPTKTKKQKLHRTEGAKPDGWWFVDSFKKHYGVRVVDGRVDYANKDGEWALGKKWKKVKARLEARPRTKIKYQGFLDPPFLAALIVAMIKESE